MLFAVCCSSQAEDDIRILIRLRERKSPDGRKKVHGMVTIVMVAMI